ncbi:hypothetical protein NDU88_003687 [Pleurodeles waltl]|uniref:Uncharacterized protein n=1 Tax=Pleurodeles waltl TaxID=8319 RepID=A0AAV7MSC8_PLEWA|nr:hypothetical protein NDU88_003687 [Pleurodeles waltl]
MGTGGPSRLGRQLHGTWGPLPAGCRSSLPGALGQDCARHRTMAASGAEERWMQQQPAAEACGEQRAPHLP